MAKINLIALIAGIATLVLIAVSVYVPWWQFTVGKPTPLAQINFSPLNFNLNLLGSSITTPLIWALNIACLLTLLSGSIVMIIYSLKPNKSYSKKLLGFAWSKPLMAVVLFAIEVVALVVLVNMIAGFNLPINGAATIQPPSGMAPGDVNLAVNVFAAFQWPFYLSIAVAALSVVARFYRGKPSFSSQTEATMQQLHLKRRFALF
jgi:hypothetical protein